MQHLPEGARRFLGKAMKVGMSMEGSYPDQVEMGSDLERRVRSHHPRSIPCCVVIPS